VEDTFATGYINTDHINGSLVPEDAKVDSVLITAYTDLSLLPYCQNCSYTTHYKLKNSIIKNQQNVQIDGHGSSGYSNDCVYGTDVSIKLYVSCPPSFYR
jgi:hypothetical protein